MPPNPAHNISPALRFNTFTLAQIRDVDALVTSVATTTAAVTYSAASMTGTLANPGPAVLRVPQLVTVTTSAQAGAYTATAITITGTLYGVAQVDTITLTQVDGNETLATTKAFDGVTSIARLAMGSGLGSIQFGVRDLIFSAEHPCRQVRHGGPGVIYAKAFNGSTAAYYDSLPGIESEKHTVDIEQIIADGTTTSASLTVYWD